MSRLMREGVGHHVDFHLNAKSVGLVKCKGSTAPEQKLNSVLTCGFSSTHYSTIRQRKRLLVTCYLTGTGLHAWQALNQTITLWHSSLTVTLTSPILPFPIAILILFLIPCLSSFTSHPFFPFTSPFMSAGRASQFPPFSHLPPTSCPPQPTSHPFPCGDFSSVKCLPGPTTPTYSLCHSLNGCSIEERGRERADTILPSSYKHHPFGCRRSGMFHSEDCRSWESTLFVIWHCRGHFLTRVSAPWALRRSHPPQPPPRVSIYWPSSLGLLDKPCSSTFV